MEQQNISLRFNGNLEDCNLPKSKKQNLFIGLIAGMRKGFFVNSLSTGINKDTLHEILIGVTKPKQESTITETLKFLQTEGERTAYSILLPYLLSSNDKKEIEKILRERFFGIELFVNRAHNIRKFLDYVHDKNIVSINENDLIRGILSWDMGELINLTRIAFEAGYINESTAWEHIKFAGEQCRTNYRNWEEIGKGYLIGQAMKCKETAETDKVIECLLIAIKDESSPWKQDYLSLSTT